MVKKLVKRHGKIKLWETSAVGLPIYPYAHKSYSLVKALTETEVSDKLNLEKSPMEEGETETDKPAEETPESKVSEPEPAEPEAEAPAEAEKTEEEKSEEAVDKGLSKEDMMEMMTKGFQAAIKASTTERGLIDNETQVGKMEEVLAKKSIGELAIMNGMFKAPDVYGRIN